MLKMGRISTLLVALLALLSSIRPAKAQVLAGIDVLEADGFRELKGKRVGLITNPTGRDRSGKSTAQILAETPGVDLVTIFTPEHGITGGSEDDHIADSQIALAGRTIPVRSLAPSSLANMRPTPDDLRKLDVVVFDIQDIGARFYTYLATMGMAMEETSKAGIEFMVLDRPNPLTGKIVEGPILDDLSLRHVTSTAYYPVSVRHGMTAGEIATMYNSEIKHPKLTIMRLQGWSRDQWYDQTGLPWTAPSPNIPDLEAATMYPGIGLFEASNLAVGRGTPVPFRWIGAPWMKADLIVEKLKTAGLEGVTFSTQDYTPTKSVFENQPCHGVRFTITDRSRLRPTELFLALNSALREIHPKEFEWSWVGAKRMIGSERFQQIYESNGDLAKFKELFEQGARDFEARRAPYLLY
jgi:uncharacterized protein YbbC (DUF1343 family)